MAPPMQIKVPDLGDFKEVEVVDVLVREGDVVDVDAALATLETEKATMDVPATAAGRIVRVLVKKGDKVSTGTAIVEIEPSATAVAVASGIPL